MDQQNDPDFFTKGNRTEVGMKASVSSSSSELLDQETRQYHFPLRGNNINPLVEACDNLFAFVIRISTLHDYQDVDQLYGQINKEILALDTELLENEQYDKATRMTCRYCICAVVDEFALRKEWGKNSLWSTKSLLSTHHGETWGGEKFYLILDRLLVNPDKYRELLEFMYICLILGYEGKYGLEADGESKRRSIIRTLNETLGHYWEKPDSKLTQADKYTVGKKFYMQVDIPAWSIFAMAGLILVAIFIVFDTLLEHRAKEILDQLSGFMN